MTDHTNGLIRPNYFDRQQLTAADLTAEQQYIRERIRRHNRFMHGWGVVSGAIVELGDTLGEIYVSEGYLVTPHGDEIYIPDDTHANVAGELDACLGAAEDPCSAVRIVDAVINPEGKDDRTDYNAEWIELLVQERMSLFGYVIQHTINPGTPREAMEDYYTFRETKPFPFGTTLRIHSGAARHHTQPEPGILHRYVADPDEVGNWRLNNRRDTIRIVNRDGVVVHTRTFTSGAAPGGENLTTAYLIACPCEEPLCPKPLMPERCQPPGGAYAWSRAREIVRLQLICELPPSHQPPGGFTPDCEALDAYVCGEAQAPPPPHLDPNDNGVVLATLTIQDGTIVDIDNVAPRRRLLSEELLLAYLRCQCQVAPPVADFTATPTVGQAPLVVTFHNQSTGAFSACSWNYNDGTAGSGCADHTHTFVEPGVYTVSLTISGPGGTDTQTRTNYITVQPAQSACALEILERGTIDVALNTTFMWPFYERGEAVGFLPDLITKLVGRLFESPIDVNLFVMSDDQYLTAIAAGQAPDLYVPRIPENLQQAVELWTRAYFLDGRRLLVVPEMWEEIGRNPDDVDAWDRTTIGVSPGDQTTAGILLAVAEAAGIVLKITEVADPRDPLLEGTILGFCAGWSGLLQLIRNDPELYRVAGPLLFVREGEEEVGLRPMIAAVRPGCPGFRDEIDESLLAMIEDDTWREIYDLWFPDPPPWTPEQLANPDLMPLPASQGGGPVFPGRGFSVEDLIREANRPVERVNGIGDTRGRRLRDAGIETLLAFTSMPVARAVAVLDMPEATVVEWQKDAWNVIVGKD